MPDEKEASPFFDDTSLEDLAFDPSAQNSESEDDDKYDENDQLKDSQDNTGDNEEGDGSGNKEGLADDTGDDDDTKKEVIDEPVDKIANYMENLGNDPRRIAEDAINHQKIGTYRKNLLNESEKTIADLAAKNQEFQEKLRELELNSREPEKKASLVDPNSVSNVIDKIRNSDNDAEGIQALSDLLQTTIESSNAAIEQKFQAQTQLKEDTSGEQEILNNNTLMVLDGAKKIALRNAQAAGDAAAVERLSKPESTLTPEEFNDVQPLVRELSELVYRDATAMGEQKYTADHIDYALGALERKNLLLPTKADRLASQPTRKVLQPDATNHKEGEFDPRIFDGMSREEATRMGERMTPSALEKALAELSD